MFLTIQSALAEALQFLLRRAVYIKHPPHTAIALKQKKDCAATQLRAVKPRAAHVNSRSLEQCIR